MKNKIVYHYSFAFRLYIIWKMIFGKLNDEVKIDQWTEIKKVRHVCSKNERDMSKDMTSAEFNKSFDCGECDCLTKHIHYGIARK